MLTRALCLIPLLAVPASGQVLLSSQGGTNAHDRLGRSVAFVGDVDQDSVPDYLAGAPGSDVAGSQAGSAFLYSGADEALIRAHHGFGAGSALGTTVMRLDDLNQDGVAEYAVGSPGNAGGYGRVQVFSGLTGNL